ncbi:formate dehydrogenase subunit gamma [Methylobacterium sp. Leaf466]|uniref:formate dehydrogenase subunit gamma n=1 Tax=Methylobacterium sp. Leaf466 TaxID=1736386 RepID=UPI0006FC3998|nr:formate dehydrogenase subunit gamma [Methylobacterium sp. Leaf466]KQT90302.1 formate dehydrogenase [Methylobacterium sp. Leaf466]
MRRGLTLFRTIVVAAALAASAPAMAQQTKDGLNPTGQNPTADSVNEEFLFKQDPKIVGRVTIPDGKAASLIQPQGRDYRAFRESWLPWIGGLAVLGAIALLAGFYLWRGRIKLERGPDSGKKILRFGTFERVTHWMTSSCFIILSLSGLNYIFGKRLLAPVIGPDAFAVVSQYAKYAHIYLAWPFMLGIALMFVVWLKDNIPNRIDWHWIKAGGGLIGNDHPHAERFNAGQKMVFWMVVGFGTAMSVTGLMMIFPFALTDITGMQVMQVVHSLIGVVFIAGILAHIYIGSVGMEGAYDAMGSGKVDLGWARSHHDLWVEKEIGKVDHGTRRPVRPVPAE